MQNYEMEKYKRLNEDLLIDEENSEMIDVMRRISRDLEETIIQFKAIAKAKGMKYSIEGSKRDASDSSLLNKSGEASSLETILNGSKLRISSAEQVLGSEEEGIAEQNEETKLDGMNPMLIEQTMNSAKQSTESNHDPRTRAEIEEDARKQEEEIAKAEAKAQKLEKMRAEGLDPADFSEEDEENNAAVIAANKKALLEWVTEADFTQEMSLKSLLEHKFKLDEEERNSFIGTTGVLKICKM